MSDLSAAPMAEWARRYSERLGLALVVIEPGEKAPKGLGWNKPGGYITDAATAEAFWQRNPNHNLGVVLGPTRTCTSTRSTGCRLSQSMTRLPAKTCVG